MPDADVIERPADGARVPETVSKSAFAELCGVTPGRVSQWIAEGKIAPASLDGEGRSAKVIVRAAVADLAEKLDLSQSAGLNGLASRLAITGLAASPLAAEPRPEPPCPPGLRQGGSGADLFDDVDDSDPGDRDADRSPFADPTTAELAKHKLRQQALRTAQMEREEAIQVGVYTLTEDHRAQVGRTASLVLNAVEAGMNTMADDLCALYPELPRRDVLHALATSFRKVRERASRGFAKQRDAVLAARAAEAEADDAEDAA